MLLSAECALLKHCGNRSFARQLQGATSVIKAITGEGFAQRPYVAVKGGVEPTTFRTDNLHLTNHAP